MRLRTEEKRDSILEIATDAFLELGYERTSMAEIASRLGGSKATLYGYFASKEELFCAVVLEAGGKHLWPAVEALAHSDELPAEALRRFGEAYLAFTLRPTALAALRMVISESGQSDIGRRFHDAGPRVGQAAIAEYLRAAVASGRLRACDPEVATRHLIALLQAETSPDALLGLKDRVSRAQIKAMVERAVDVFMRAYAPAP